MKRRYAIWINRFPVSFYKGKWEYVTETHEVRIMAEAEGYAMVRRKGCMPFVVSIKNLRPIEAASGQA